MAYPLNSATAVDSTTFMQSIRDVFSVPQTEFELYIPSALEQLQLTHELSSLKCLDHLIHQYQAKVGFFPIEFSKESKYFNSLLYLSSHIGKILAQQLNCSEQWIHIHELIEQDREYLNVVNDLHYQYALICQGEIIFPLRYLIQHFTQAPSGYTFSEEIEILYLNLSIKIVEETQQYQKEMQSLEIIYQMHYPFYCGRCFDDLLKITDLDYTLNSLDRLDELLREIKQNYMFTPEQFISMTERRYFLQYIAIYIAQVIAQNLQSMVQWHHPDDITKQFHVFIPLHFHTSRIAEIQGTFFYVMQHVCDFLFSKIPPQSSLKYAQDIIHRVQNQQHKFNLIDNSQLDNVFLKQQNVKAVTQLI